MVVGSSVYEWSDEKAPSLLEGLQPNDLVVGEVLFTEFRGIYGNGYTEGSIEEVASGTVLLFECLKTRYDGIPPRKYEDPYYDVERAIEALSEDPYAANCLAETKRILGTMECFLQHFSPGAEMAEQYEYIYGLYDGVVDPYLIKMGNGEIDAKGVIREIESALYPKMTMAYHHKNASGKKVKTLML